MTPATRQRLFAYLVLLTTLSLWSGNWIVARAVRDDIAPGLATSGRLVLVLALLLPFTWAGLRRKFGQFTRRDLGVFLAMGFCGGGLHLAMQWLALHYTTATSAVLYLSTSPIFILILAGPLLGEVIGLRQWLGVAVSFAGVALIGTQGRVGVFEFNIGDAMAIASMAMFGGYTLLLRVRRDALDTAELLTVVCLLGFIYMAPWAALELYWGKAAALSGTGAVAVLYSALGSLLLAYVGWSYVVTRLGAARAGVTMHLMPALGVLMAVVFLGEYPRWFHGAGIVLILAGVALSSSGKRG